MATPCVKIYFGDEVRRFAAAPAHLSAQDFFAQVRGVLHHPLNGLEGSVAGAEYKLMYTDDEGDQIRIASTPELVESTVAQVDPKLLKYRVCRDGSRPDCTTVPASAAPPAFAVFDMLTMLVENVRKSHAALLRSVKGLDETTSMASAPDVQKLCLEARNARDHLANFGFGLHSVGAPAEVKERVDRVLQEMRPVITEIDANIAALKMGVKFRRFSEKKDKIIRKTFDKKAKMELVNEKHQRQKLMMAFKEASQELWAQKQAFKRSLKRLQEPAPAPAAAAAATEKADKKALKAAAKAERAELKEMVKAEKRAAKAEKLERKASAKAAAKSCRAMHIEKALLARLLSEGAEPSKTLERSVSLPTPTAPPCPLRDESSQSECSQQRPTTPVHYEPDFEPFDEEEDLSEELAKLVEFGIDDLELAKQLLKDNEKDVFRVYSKFIDLL